MAVRLLRNGIVAVAVAVLAPACASSDTETGDGPDGPRGPPGEMLEVDPPSAIPEHCRDPAEVNADGVLTTFPHLDFEVVPAGFKLESVHFAPFGSMDGDEPSLFLLAEVKNETSEVQCEFLPTVALGGLELVGILEASPYYGSFTTGVTSRCIPPGGTGVLTAIELDITRAVVLASATLFVDVGANNFQEFFPAVEGPILTEDVAETEGGWVIRGEAKPIVTIYNYAIRAYPMDARGVLVGEMLAFPLDLTTLSAGAVVPFETTAVPCKPVDYHLYDSWIVD